MLHIPNLEKLYRPQQSSFNRYGFLLFPSFPPSLVFKTFLSLCDHWRFSANFHILSYNFPLSFSAMLEHGIIWAPFERCHSRLSSSCNNLCGECLEQGQNQQSSSQCLPSPAHSWQPNLGEYTKQGNTDHNRLLIVEQLWKAKTKLWGWRSAKTSKNFSVSFLFVSIPPLFFTNNSKFH